MMNSSSRFIEPDRNQIGNEGHMSQQSVLNAFDFSAIEEMDPSLAEGHTVVFDREAPFELRIQDPNSGPQEVGTLEAIRVKILTMVSDFLFLTVVFRVSKITFRIVKSNLLRRTICSFTILIWQTKTVLDTCKNNRNL